MVDTGLLSTDLPFGSRTHGALGNVGIAPVRKFSGFNGRNISKEIDRKQDFIEEGCEGNTIFRIVCSSHLLLHLYELYNFK